MLKKAAIIVFLLIYSFIVFVSWSLAQSNSIKYFEGQGCQHCAKVDEYFEKRGLFKKYQIERYEVYFNRQNAAKLQELFTAYNVPEEKKGVPIIFFADKYLSGEKEMIDNFESMIAAIGSTPQPPPAIKNNIFTTTLPAVIIASLVDAINPCEFAVLLILLAATTIVKKDKTALFSGLAFSGAIFISYFLMGFGIYKALSLGKFSLTIIKFIGLSAIILGILNLKDFFWYGKGFVMEVPFSWRPKMKQIIRRVTSPVGAFFVGLLVSLFLLPCTSGPYIVTLGMLSQRETFLKALVYLFIYNLIFVSPMLIITFLVYFGTSPEKLEEIRQKNIKRLHLIAGLLLLLLGGYILLS